MLEGLWLMSRFMIMLELIWIIVARGQRSAQDDRRRRGYTDNDVDDQVSLRLVGEGVQVQVERECVLHRRN